MNVSAANETIVPYSVISITELWGTVQAGKYAIDSTRRMFNITCEREPPNLSAGCIKSHTNAFRQRERNALPFLMVFVSGLVIYTRTVQLH